MNRIDTILLHIKEDCEEILEFIEGVDEKAFIENAMIKKAVAMSLINVGELVKALPMEFREAHDELPWRRIAGFRDLAAHKYKTLDISAVWIVAKERVPEILEFINRNIGS